MPERGRYFSIEEATLSGRETVDEERLEPAKRKSAGEKGGQKDKRDSSGHMAWQSSKR